MTSGQRFLVLRYSSLGDVVLTTPLLRALRKAYPHAHVTFATKVVYGPVVGTNPNVNAVVLLRAGQHLLEHAGAIGRGYDRVIDLHGSLRTGALRFLVGGKWSSYRNQRLERRRILRTRDITRPQLHVSERYFDAVRSLGVEPDGEGPEMFPTEDDMARARSIVTGDYAVLAPGASRANKRWPVEHWRGLAERLARQGLQVVAAGLPRERFIIPEHLAMSCFDEPIRVVAALCGDARVVVANDSGVAHVASAVGAPVISLFGPTSPAFGFAPLGQRSRVVERSLECRPCSALGGDVCPVGHHRCLTEIEPDDVAREALAV